ncbi:hypothetical protein RHMOL_Rhmol05G0210000 [Rhododendron molle]|uniref:Uncharacterized protein n=1 Tax=Rhododendron molle TaxID=49168 RepID=A0ACC0NSW4_RHOML|nr:hypothetical protein RHMOL_Rhmol05G0210000 [Rhododendron molle]
MEAMEPVFDFHFGGELEDDVVDIKELELQGLVSLDIGLGAVEHYGQLDIGLHDWFILLWRLLCLVALNYYGLVVVFILDL